MDAFEFARSLVKLCAVRAAVRESARHKLRQGTKVPGGRPTYLPRGRHRGCCVRGVTSPPAPSRSLERKSRAGGWRAARRRGSRKIFGMRRGQFMSSRTGVVAVTQRPGRRRYRRRPSAAARLNRPGMGVGGWFFCAARLAVRRRAGGGGSGRLRERGKVVAWAERDGPRGPWMIVGMRAARGVSGPVPVGRRRAVRGAGVAPRRFGGRRPRAAAAAPGARRARRAHGGRSLGGYLANTWDEECSGVSSLPLPTRTLSAIALRGLHEGKRRRLNE